MPSFKSVFATAAFLAAANAKVVKITAKSDDKFDPDSTTASAGDILEFHFEASNHSVVAGDYQYPCSPLQIGTGFFSGFFEVSSGESDKVFRVTLNNTEPLAYYSSQGNECASGMVGIVNPSGNKTLDDYKSRASKLARGVTPGKTSYGGEVADKSSSADDSNDSKGNGKGDSKGDGKSDGKSDGKDDKKGGKSSANMVKASSLAVAGVFAAAVYML